MISPIQSTNIPSAKRIPMVQQTQKQAEKFTAAQTARRVAKAEQKKTSFNWCMDCFGRGSDVKK